MAFESLLRPWSSERILYRDDVLCIVDKPAGVACGPSVSPAPGQLDVQSRLEQAGLGPLRLSLPLPQRASGVTVLAASGASGPASIRRGELPEAVRELSFVVALDDCRLPARGHLRLSETDPTARLVYRVLRRQGARALLELRGAAGPELVARTLARHGQPIVGDAASGGAACTRLMLHVSGCSGAVVVTAPLPDVFESWLEGAAQVPAAGFADALARAGLVRYGIWPEYEAYRLIGEGTGELSGITIDRYADYAVLAISSEEAWLLKEQIAECLMDHGARGVYLKRRLRTDLRSQSAEELAPPGPLRGEAAPQALELRQGPVRFRVQLGEGLSTGLFLDQRANWARVAEGARGKSLLNLFSYTGAFSVFAAAGGATATVSVDLAGRALARLRENLELNGLSGPDHRLLKDDVVSWLRRAGRGPRRFDWIVLDPPSFGTRARGVLSTERDYVALLRGALDLLEPRGQLLCVSHHRKISTRELVESVEGACRASARRVKVEPLVGAWDCPSLPGVSGTKSVLARLQ